MREEANVFLTDIQPPMILRGNRGWALLAKPAKKSNQTIPKTIEFVGVKFELVGCTYGDGGHFVAIVQRDQTLWFHDGMMDSGIFVKYSSNEFPVNVGGKSLNEMYYLQSSRMVKCGTK